MRERQASAEEKLARLQAVQALTTAMAGQIGAAQQLQPVLSAVLEAMRSLVEFQGGTIQLVDSGGVYVAATDPPVSPEVLKARVPVGTGLGGRVVATGEAIYSPDIGADPRVDPELRRLGSNARMRSYLGVPLVCLGEVIGLMQVDSQAADAFDRDDLEVLQAMAPQVAGAIESARRAEAVRHVEQLKTDFLSNVSHQLRTPLTIISGFVATLQTYGSQLDESRQEQMLTRISKASSRLAYLIEEILTVTQLQAGDVTPRVKPTEVLPVVTEVLDNVDDPSEVSVDCPDGLIVLSDGRLLRLALAHLVDNALRYSGSCTVKAGPATDGHVAIEVRDEGPGLSDSVKRSLFDTFSPGGSEDGGIGLGLALVKAVTNALGAAVETEDLRPGLAVRLKLPG